MLFEPCLNCLFMNIIHERVQEADRDRVNASSNERIAN